MKKYFFAILLPVAFFASSVSAASLGERVVFNVDSGYEIKGRTQVNASLRQLGQSVYFYVEDDYWNSLAAGNKDILRNALSNLTNEFDNVIYPKERSVFGSEWNPGIDNDGRITVLVLELTREAGGYFNTFDEYPKSMVASSNEREMFYLNVLNVAEPQAKAYLAHEFQHLISFHQKTKLYGLTEDVWLNEARSEYAPSICGYNSPYPGSYLADRVDAFLDAPSDSLTEWKNKIADYGSAGLFLHYLTGRFGTEFLTRLTLNSKIGIASVSQALTDSGASETFGDVFADWAVANYLNDCSLSADGRYCYKNQDLTYERLHTDYSASYSGFPNLIVSRSSAIPDWSPRWYRFNQGAPGTTGKDTFKLEFSGLDGQSDFRVPYVVNGSNNETTVAFMPLLDQKGAIYIPQFTSSGKTVTIIPFNQYKKSNFGSNEPMSAFSFTASSLDSSILIINSVAPTTGSVVGGYEITIKGENLNAATQIFFGDAGIANFKLVDNQTITFIAPAHAAGRVDVVAINSKNEQVGLGSAFTYLGSGQYPDGSLIRAAGDYKVYIVSGGYKRWIQHEKIFNAYGHLRWENIIEVTPEVLAGHREAWLIRAYDDKKVYEVDASGVKHWLNMSAEQFNASGRDWNAVYIVNRYERDFYQTGAEIKQ